ncbi:MAG: succinate--CoA ligase subunit alpha [Candidatus Magasanikbacteria bacterium CG10_big_fil_rev_8_21_14_0_10_36_16]|uniref:Succinate--CoA ligase subunit alpha n=1 Tax=Candidatus Magasanikbacteria bacterium CG10_big_fil_rev_8_21_14_0_10_36_16 TaxID=1974645 RepID=A0A2H0TZD5_9BACT|nr:MAG: succinate--CoA ligase subunit alpha [Candidatus Magasanikbacteria bacterium CG10_big_fil_rev_8_21_14_0_10_36_16]
MSILINKNTKVLVQGITGNEGEKAAKAMLDYGTNVIGGVRPGKGGEEVLGKPVFNTVAEAVAQFPDITTTAIYVPPFSAKTAIVEAIEAGISQINTIIERVPIRDTAYCLAAAKEKNIQIIGPSSLGYISPGIGRIGVVGGPKAQADEIFTPGSIGIISRSGGMTNEVSWQVRKAGLGQSTAVHVGGDLLMGTTYADLLKLFEKDSETKAVIIFGEHGGSYEFEIVDLIKNKEYTKPLAIYIGGKFASTLPEGMNIGHAGAIVERGKGAVEKAKALAEVGVMIADRYEDLVTLIKPYF